ncbi:LirA/MavJ family T4SS effector [Legionella tunisiensis]|uniref:LirA/MavJ family T4SS effector n=1 Tax=Legionella tunisiensis TaxID=1034944 RepID=UPI00030C7676|nr:LirA/MavJ family T4SS effector [Legionella tunisiensis]
MPKKDSNSIDSLHLDTKQQTCERKHPIFLLIKSLKDNYDTYAEMIAKKEIKSGTIEKTFYAIPKIDIPEMKDSSSYKSWDKFIRKMQNFLDGKNPDYIAELTKLESKLQNEEAKLQRENPNVDLNALFEKILENFEEKAGFSSLKIIEKNAGVLTADVFFEMVRKGHPLTDLGASEQHGKLSHRLQFFY